MIAVAVYEFGANAYYYGVQFSLGQIGTDFGYNILLTGVIETTAFLTSSTPTPIQTFSSQKCRAGWADYPSTSCVWPWDCCFSLISGWSCRRSFWGRADSSTVVLS